MLSVLVLACNITTTIIINWKVDTAVSITSMNRLLFCIILLASLLLSACAGTIISTAADVVIETAKVPFKVTGAVIDVATGDDEDD